MFSIIIPTWNNLDYLKLCVASIKKHSAHAHEIIVHVNESESDGTLDWVRAQGLKHSHSRQNIGICLSVNHLASQTSRDWLLYMNDDMVCCPGWDSALVEATHSAPANKLAYYSSTLIEPGPTSSTLVLVQDFGRTPAEFDEERMIAGYMTQTREDIIGACLQPTLLHRIWWNVIGGYSIEFSPGLSSDNDLMMKLWMVGCRTFRMVGASRLYHFAEKSTKRVRRNRGGRTFVMKWGITQNEFYRNYLAKTANGCAALADTDGLPPPQVNLTRKDQTRGL